MGKSTFLMRLALHMAHRGLGKEDDLRQRIEPTLVPLFISLGLYATFRQQHQKEDEKGKSIWAYLQTRPTEMIELRSAETLAWLKQELADGHCLVCSMRWTRSALQASDARFKRRSKPS